ncbi:2-oxoglutarate dehydrogenase complex dihydrolipoyllysine-residue succinyltransferase [Algoriphagus halophytocola]|uniref:Dihydrolipoyllysine-residue succinyltransferase component of 2-oxoglutarate dehydrogenase complex n=1 Tax=Algoriphagus halophytocola TaxID=2991499 RepID=A0ABY6MBN6_9BACT|nr:MULTISPECIES: 2-oxoglutarate dehydrogenase complex dihydrolipoyllysine-residue succinyltransferase [unclassified Algoriphagus]UZD21027.1 2-oxoglutarate dehydrogenase complex dihydrolipoyllysine-residue succinyltransferase [Algoriphagus sp. TR-M5]WBL42193.1 2-oxoglutarate dehydrogenase complex dihydrolipoyllysine-residue succinyltransferase [Algoriphagus sp. TR-M9]
MSKEIKVPAVGESITEVTIGQWFKNDGDEVQMDEVLCELESDKATFELPAEASGILKIKAQEGDVLEIGAVICEIDEAGTPGKSAPSKESESTPKTEEKSSGAKTTGEVKEMVVPTVGESITEVTLANWIKGDGDYVKLDEIIAEVDSDKATFELPAEASGILRHVAAEGDVLEIGGMICKIEVTEGEPAAAASSEPSAESAASSPSGDSNYATGHASPAAAKILAEKGISPESVKGTGKDGRITKEDAQAAQKPAPAPAKAEKKPAAAAAQEPVSGSRNERREKMSSLRKTVAKRLVSVKNETAMLTTFNEVNMKPIMDLRSKFKEQFKEKHGVGLGFMSFFTKAVCVALQEWPAVNAKIDGNEIVYNDYCDISIAVSAPKGLVVPVIRNAETLSFDQVEKEVVRLATKARDNKLSIEEMTGGTFTLTNGGIFGSMMSTPIINAPQSAILGMHNIVQRPMAVNGEVVILPMMYVALSYDHRIIDGRESVSFLVRVKELLEDPTRLLFGV